VVLGQVALELSIAQGSDSIKRYGILVRSKPVAFFGKAHCYNAKIGARWPPLCYLPQELWIMYEIRGPIETHWLFYRGRIT
jgi:hypothetical protein